MKVYFLQRHTQRKRQRETVEFCPSEIEKITPKNMSFIPDQDLYALKHFNKKRKIFNKIARMVPINCRRIGDSQVKEANYIYTWACFPFMAPKPYIIEIDNPYALCLYNQHYFTLMKPVLRKLLLSKKCKKIVCISQACLNTLKAELDSDVASKAAVVYPYMKNRLDSKCVSENAKIEFLFVSTSFYIKGGRETLIAFNEAFKEHPEIHLTMISNTPDEILETYDNKPWVSFVKADLDKKALHDNYFSKVDVFILPTYQDSLGMVFLEALSFGLPIIATNLYATPEFVQDGVNGLTFDAPFYFFNKDFTKNINLPQDLEGKVISDGEYKEVSQNIYQSIIKLTDQNMRLRMAEESKLIFLEKYDVSIRNEAFMNLFTE